MFLQSVHLALRTIARNKLRSVLTLLGVIIGVAAVVALVTIGRGARERIRSELAGMGTHLIFVFAGMVPDPSSPSVVEAQPLTNEQFNGLAKILGARTTVAALAASRLRVSHGGRSISAPVTGVNQSYFALREWTLERGRLLSPLETASNASVCVIGSKVAKSLFGQENAIGARIRVGQIHCRVVGELAARGATFSGGQDTLVLLPLGLFQTRLSGKAYVDQILIGLHGDASIAPTKLRVMEEMRRLRRIGPARNDDFQVDDMTEYMHRASSVIDNVTALLSSIAAISLLVGGIGIMNIMLVSVSERTREIGIRMATGARAWNILQQFLTEAWLVSAIGGLIGVVIGIAATRIIGSLGTPIHMTLLPMALAFSCAFATGLLFGFLTARKAAHLDPVHALASE